MQRLEAAAKEVDAQSSKIFRLEVELAEAQKKLQTTTELEKELNHYRCYSTSCLFHPMPGTALCNAVPLRAPWPNTVGAGLTRGICYGVQNRYCSLLHQCREEPLLKHVLIALTLL